MDSTTIYQQVTAFIASGQGDFVGGIAASMTLSLISKAWGGVKRRFAPTEKQAALQSTIERALIATFFDLKDRPEQFEHSVAIFGEWAVAEDILDYLVLLIDPRVDVVLDIPYLALQFEQAGFDRGTLGFSFEERVAQFIEMFYQFARREPVLIDDATLQIDVLQQMLSALVAAQEDRRAARIAAESSATSLKKLAADPAVFATKTYLTQLITDCNQLDSLMVLSLDIEDTRQITLQDVYIDLNTTDRVAVAETDRQRAGLERDRPLSALEATAQSGRAVLLGDPGSGKSSFVRYLSLRLALAALRPESHHPPQGWSRLIPLVVTLRELGTKLAALEIEGQAQKRKDEALRNAVWAQIDLSLKRLEADPFISCYRSLLQQKKVAIFFDGLDEVPSSVRPRLIQAIRAIEALYGATAHIVVTCRVRSYPTDNPRKLLLPGFDVYTLAPFTREQIDNFITAWYKVARVPAGQRQERTDDLQHAAREPDLFRLAQNPMLLTTMALIHQTNTRLPKERVKLYEQAVEVLLLRWQKHRGLEQQVDPDVQALLENAKQVRAILERLGYEAHLLLDPQAESADLTRKDIIAILETKPYLGDPGLAGKFLDYIDHRAGLLIGRGGDDALDRPQLYSFPHRTFLQYLAGCYLTRERERRDMIANFRDLLARGSDWAVAAQMGAEFLLHKRDDVGGFLDLAYALCPSRAPRSAAQWRGVVWSGHMALQLERREIELDEDENGGSAYLTRLADRLEQVLTGTQLPVLERAEAGRYLSRLGDTRPGVLDVRHTAMCYVPGGRFYMGDGDERHLNTTLERGYWIGRFPVTQAHFRQFVADGGYANPDFWPEAIRNGRWREPGEVKAWNDADWRETPYDFGDPFSLENHPVVGIMWYEAQAFTRWLNATLAPPSGWRILLASEAEWEKAARGGLHVPQQALYRPMYTLQTDLEPEIVVTVNELEKRAYPWGDHFSANHANSKESQIGSSNAVGCFLLGQSPIGCEEMSGNVFEWTRSQDGSYPYRPYDGREQTDKVKDNIVMQIRGGAHYMENEWSRCAARVWYHPYFRLNARGFRIVLSPLSSSDL